VRIKLDENLHLDLAAVFATAGHDVDTVADEGLLGAEDASVLAAGSGEERLIVTLDRGFGDIRAYPPGTHCGVVVLRLDDNSLPATRAAVENLVSDVDLEGLAGCVAVYRSGSLRVRRAPDA
jgi:predicted nuclease of predicted toxin-antitoxin system